MSTELLKRANASLEKLNQPDYRATGMRHTSHDGNVEGVWVPENPKLRKKIKSFQSRNFDRRKFDTTFKTFSGMLREGVRAFNDDLGGHAGHQANFAQRYGSLWKDVQGMQEGVGSAGGFTVLPEFAPDIYDRVYDNDLWNRTDQYTVTGNSMKFPKSAETNRRTGQRAGGIMAYWTAEGAPITGSHPKLARTELELNKLAIVVYLTQELMEDNSYALEQWVSKKVSEEFNFMIGNALINGSGAGQPLGILNAGATITCGGDSGTHRVAQNTVSAADILTMWTRRIPGQSVDGIVWLYNQSVERSLAQMSLPAGVASPTLVYMPPQGLAEKPYATILGMPAMSTEFNPDLGTAGDIMMVDLKQYVTISKGGVSEAVSMHVEFLTDQLALRFIMRVDGRPYDDTPITGFNTTDTYSPFVALNVHM